MDEAEKQKINSELKDLYKELRSYKRWLDPKRELSESQKRYRESLREGLIRKTGRLKGTIIQLTGKQFYTRFGRIHDFWAGGLNFGYRDDLGLCINATNEAIGKLKSIPVDVKPLDIGEESKEKVGKETKLGDLLQEKLEQLRPMYSHGAPAFPQQHSESLIRWQSQVEVILRSFFGAESPQLKQFKEATSVGPNPMTAPDPFVIKAEAALESILFELKISKPHKYRKVLQWIKSHKIPSIIIMVITLIAAIITIVGFAIGFFNHG